MILRAVSLGEEDTLCSGNLIRAGVEVAVHIVPEEVKMPFAEIEKNTEKVRRKDMNFVIAVFVGIWFWFAGGAPGYTFHYVLKQPWLCAALLSAC